MRRSRSYRPEGDLAEIRLMGGDSRGQPTGSLFGN